MENKVKSHYLNVLEKDQQEMVTMVQLFDRAERSGLVIEVIYSALNNMKEFPDSSPLLCMQIALEDWDV
tara:strand:- start:389 stop:595 length:207 start_codon:yes stop_codon:yes gene_type:complete